MLSFSSEKIQAKSYFKLCGCARFYFEIIRISLWIFSAGFPTSRALLRNLRNVVLIRRASSGAGSGAALGSFPRNMIAPSVFYLPKKTGGFQMCDLFFWGGEEACLSGSRRMADLTPDRSDQREPVYCADRDARAVFA